MSYMNESALPQYDRPSNLTARIMTIFVTFQRWHVTPGALLRDP